VALGACGAASGRLDNRRVARAIEAAIRRQRHLETRVTCPRARRRAGEVFGCVATPVKLGPQTFFEVTELDDAGHIHFLGLR
jgi:hypothetical protein